MLSLSDLNPFIFGLVCDELRSDPSSPFFCPLKALCLVNRRIYHVVLPHLFRHVTLDITGDDTSKSAMFIQYMFDKKGIRELIREITLLISQENYDERIRYKYVQRAFKRLLPQLSGLHQIRLIGLHWPRTSTAQDMRSLDPSILEAISALDPTPALDVQTYTHTVNSEYLLDKVSNLRSLKVNLVNIAYWSPQGRKHGKIDRNASPDIARVLSQNPGLKHLALGLQGTKHEKHILFDYERDNALENIGGVVSRLKSLTIGDYLKCTHTAGEMWAKALDWSQLQSLEINNISVIDSLIPHLNCPMPRLKTVKLSTGTNQYNRMKIALDYPRPGVEFEDLLPEPHKYDAFFSLLTNVERLSLSNFHLDIIYILNSNKALRYLHIHIDDVNPTGARGKQTPLISQAQLETLRQTCPNLEWLAIDVPHNVLQPAELRAHSHKTYLNREARSAETQNEAFNPHISINPSQISMPTISHEREIGSPPGHNAPISVNPNSITNPEIPLGALIEGQTTATSPSFGYQHQYEAGPSSIQIEADHRRLQLLRQQHTRMVAQQLAQENTHSQMAWYRFQQLPHSTLPRIPGAAIRRSFIEVIARMERLRHLRLHPTCTRLLYWTPTDEPIAMSPQDKKESALRFFKDLHSAKTGSTLQSLQVEHWFISRLGPGRVMLRFDQCRVTTIDAHAKATPGNMMMHHHFVDVVVQPQKDTVCFEEWNIDDMVIIKTHSFDQDFIVNGAQDFTNMEETMMPPGWDDIL